MSYSEVLGITLKPKIEFESIEILGNSYGTGYLVWKLVAEKYMGLIKAFDYPNKGWMQKLDELWPLYKDKKIPKAHRAVLLLTYDYAYVSKDNYHRMASDIRGFLQDFDIPSDHVNHLPRIAEIFESRPSAPYIGLYICSVAENVWHGKWNDDKDDYEPLESDKPFNVYEVLDEL